MGNEQSQHYENSQKTGILQMRNFKLKQIPPEIMPIANSLRNLDLSNNRIQEIPTGLFAKMQILKTLNLANNKLRKHISIFYFYFLILAFFKII